MPRLKALLLMVLISFGMLFVSCPVQAVAAAPRALYETLIGRQLGEAGDAWMQGPTATNKPRDLRTVISLVIFVLLALVGITLLILFLYASFLWFSARGNDEQVTKAKTIFRNAIIGFILVAVSYTLMKFVFSSFFAPYQTTKNPSMDSPANYIPYTSPSNDPSRRTPVDINQPKTP